MSLARDITTVGSGTLISRLVAFARDAVIAAWLGAGPFSEAFFAMLQVINFFGACWRKARSMAPSCRFGSRCARPRMARPTPTGSPGAACWRCCA